MCVSWVHVAVAPSNSVRTSPIRRARFRGVVPSLLLLSAYIARDDDIDYCCAAQKKRRMNEAMTHL